MFYLIRIYTIIIKNKLDGWCYLIMNFGSVLLDIIGEFGGQSSPSGLGPYVVRFLLPSVFWLVLIGTSLATYRGARRRRDYVLSLVFALGLSRELFMFIVHLSQDLGFISFHTIHLFFPPLEHALLLGSTLMLAYVFLRYQFELRSLSHRYLIAGISLLVLGYLALAFDWYRFSSQNPNALFGFYKGDLIAHFFGAGMMAVPIYVFLFAKERVLVAKFMVVGFCFFFLDEVLKIVDIFYLESYKYILDPIRHNLHIWGIPFFGSLYYVDMRVALNEVTLQSEEEKQKTLAILAAMGDGVSMQDTNYHILYQNNIMKKMLGDHKGAQCFKAYYDNMDETCPGCPLKLSFQDGEVHHGGRQIVEDNVVHYWEITTFPLRDAHGKIIAGVEVVRDVTEQKRAEEELRKSEALRESEQVFASIFFASPIAAMITTIDDQKIIKANDAFVRLSGYQLEEVMNLSCSELNLWVDYEMHEQLIASLAKNLTVRSFEVQIKTAAGKLRDCLFSVEIIMFGGEPHLLSVLVDISMRKQAEESLRRSEKEHRMIFENSPMGIIHFDAETKITSCNENLARLFGLPRHKIVGLKVEDLINNQELISVLEQALQGEIGSFEGDFPSPDGETVPFKAVFGPNVAGDDSVLGGIGIVEGTRERKIAEEVKARLEERMQQSQKMEAIGLLAGGIAHDFNNLLVGIMGHADMLLLDAPRDSTTYQAAKTIGRAAERAAELTRQLLGFARKGKFQIVPVDLHAVIQEVVNLLERTIDKNIRIDMDLQAENAVVLGDPAQLQQVFLNLAVNARDAMPDGGEFRLSTAYVEHDDESWLEQEQLGKAPFLEVRLCDTGSGMSDEVQKHIFEPFFTTKKQGEGTGMGLAMAYGTIKNHGGTIAVESKSGKGTTFNVYLPLANCDISPQRKTKPGDLVEGDGHILLVDDEDFVRQATCLMLEELGYDVVTTKNGIEAVEYYREHYQEIDLVIIDMVMPLMGARECFLTLKEINPEVKALLVSGYTIDGKAQEIIDLGMRGFAQKPFTMKELSQKVAEAFPQKS